MKPTSKRAIAVLGVAILAAAVLAACGGSSTTTTTTTSSSAAANAAPSSSAGTAPTTASAAARTKLAACLKKYGVTLPVFAGRPGGFGGATGGAGAFGRRFGATGATGPRRFLGATGARGFPGTGRPGGFGGSNPAFAAALAKCGGAAGFGGGRFGASGASGVRNPATNPQYRAEIVSYAACMKTNGVTQPKPNFSGKGFVFGTSVSQTSPAFVAANAKCQTLLRPAAPASG